MRSSLGTPARDWVLVVALSVLAVWEVPQRVTEGGAAAWVTTLTAACVVPLAWRRSAPLPCVLVTAVAFAVYPLVDGSPEVLTQALALLLALYAAAVACDSPAARAALLVGVAAGLSRSLSIGEYDTGSAIVNAAWAVPPWLVGRAVRQRERRAATAESLAEETLERAARVEQEAIELERQRIARELHDVVAHAVTVMVVQARGGRHCVEGDPDAARAAFLAVEEQGRQALAELRRLLSVLPSGASAADAVPDPLPGLGSVDALVERMRKAGLDVRLTREGTGPALSPAAEFSAYRVLQEALTNALRYSGDGPTEVRVRHHVAGVDLEVSNPAGGQPGLGSGAGLVGARERVTAFGGRFRAGLDGATFVLSVSLPGDAGAVVPA